jgi:hypothetical protein
MGVDGDRTLGGGNGVLYGESLEGVIDFSFPSPQTTRLTAPRKWR